MALSDRLRRQGAAFPGVDSGGTGVNEEAFSTLKTRLHQSIIERLDLKNLEKLDPAVLQGQLRSVIGPMLTETSAPLNQAERERMVQELLDELTGLGPLEPLLKDPTISDILVNTYS